MIPILTIAGSDSSGGAGIQADLKTFSYYKLFGMSVITAITAQNTTSIIQIQNLSSKLIKNQLISIFSDINCNTIKIGMLSSSNCVIEIVKILKKYKPKNIVIDPVMISTSRHKLVNEKTIQYLIKFLFPLATIITPNIYEAEILSNSKINNFNDMTRAIKKISHFQKNVAILIKSGDLKSNKSNDLLMYKNNLYWFNDSKINNKNVHGSGCTLSSAIAANLALNCDLVLATKNAKNYVYECIGKRLNLGKGKGPLNHF